MSTSLSDRRFDSTVPLLFDLNSEESRRNAEACYWALLEAGRGQDFLPYRVGIQTMNWLSQNDTTFWQVVREIKKTLDPHAIMSPGRYVWSLSFRLLAAPGSSAFQPSNNGDTLQSWRFRQFCESAFIRVDPR